MIPTVLIKISEDVAGVLGAVQRFIAKPMIAEGEKRVSKCFTGMANSSGDTMFSNMAVTYAEIKGP